MLVTTSAQSRIAAFVQVVAPQLYWRRRYGALARLGEARPDIRLVRALCHPGYTSYFNIDGTLHSVDEFDAHRRQDPANTVDSAAGGAHIFLPTSR